jgi:asparagine N-glycosylation enzyme membrane subunit Stt3
MLEIGDSAAHGMDNLRHPSWDYLGSIGVGLVLLTVAAILRSRAYHVFVLVLFLVLLFMNVEMAGRAQ